MDMVEVNATGMLLMYPGVCGEGTNYPHEHTFPDIQFHTLA